MLLPREVALEILSQQEIGSFIIRDSTTHPGCYALSVKVPRYDNPSGISHYLITRTAKGSFKIKVGDLMESLASSRIIQNIESVVVGDAIMDSETRLSVRMERIIALIDCGGILWHYLRAFRGVVVLRCLRCGRSLVRIPL